MLLANIYFNAFYAIFIFIGSEKGRYQYEYINFDTQTVENFN